MRPSSLRRTLLALIAQVLERWLHVVTTRLEPVAERPPADSRQPSPPDHWVDLVRQHALQLLDSEPTAAADSSAVIDWQADDAPPEMPLSPPTAKPRPLRLQPTQQRPPPVVPTRRPMPKRPLRLQQVGVQPLDAEDVNVTAMDASADAIPPEFVRTTTRPVQATLPIYTTDMPQQGAPAFAGDRFDDYSTEPVTPPLINTSLPAVSARRGEQRRFRLPSLLLPIRRGRGKPPVDAASPATDFTDTPLDPQDVRAVRASIPFRAEQPNVSDARTRVGGSVQPHQQGTSVPPALPAGAPPQRVLRPSQAYPALNIDDITPDHWASLPDSPADEPRTSGADRYERLKREQEGRAWSE